MSSRHRSSLRLIPAKVWTRPSWISQAIRLRSPVMAELASFSYSMESSWNFLRCRLISSLARTRASISCHMNFALVPRMTATPTRSSSSSAFSTPTLPVTSMIRSTSSELNRSRKFRVTGMPYRLARRSPGALGSISATPTMRTSGSGARIVRRAEPPAPAPPPPGHPAPPPLLNTFLDAVRAGLQRRHADGTFLTGLFQAGQHLGPVEGLPPPVFFDDHGENFLHPLVGGEPPLAPQAFPASADGLAFFRHPRVHDLVFNVATKRASHRRPPSPYRYSSKIGNFPHKVRMRERTSRCTV